MRGSLQNNWPVLAHVSRSGKTRKVGGAVSAYRTLMRRDRDAVRGGELDLRPEKRTLVGQLAKSQDGL